MNRKAANDSIPMVVVCHCDRYVCRVAEDAARTLTQNGHISYIGKPEHHSMRLLQQAIAQNWPTLVVDGCRLACCHKELQKADCQSEFSLNLADLGIEDRDDNLHAIEDSILVQDAIIAGSTRSTETYPRILGGCGCR